MTKEEFGKWYRAHINDMVKAGVMHPESEGGRWVKLALTASASHYGPILDQLQQRIVSLEAEIYGDKPKVIPKIKQPEPQVLEPLPVEEPVVETKPKKKAASRTKKVQEQTKKPVSKGWSV